MNWDIALHQDVSDFLNIYEKAYNCPKDLIMPALLTLTASLCGPKARILGNGEAFQTSLNMFAFAVADPGTGKSSVFEKVMEPVFEMYSKITGKQIHLENYTTAGFHKHQQENDGYGIVTSDEGHRFLSSVQNKQGKGEGERALLCKLWNGKGDHVTLSTGNRGFNETSFSMFLLIQPQPFLQELSHMMSGDGLLDRFLMFSVCPSMNTSAVVRQHFELLQESPIKSFDTVFKDMYNDHKQSAKTYVLTEEAQNVYDNMTDSYAEYINMKYCSEEDTLDKENINPSQHEDSFMISSKDTIHILRLACLLHILNTYLKKVLNPALYKDDEEQDTAITSDSMKAAKNVYHNIAKQKSIFLEAANNLDNKEEVILPKVRTFKERVLKCACNQEGPMISVRRMQRHIKGSLADNIRMELEELQKNGFGQLVGFPSKNVKKYWFMKPVPSTVSANHEVFRVSKVSHEMYSSKFKSVNAECTDRDLSHHYQYELVAELLDGKQSDCIRL